MNRARNHRVKATYGYTRPVALQTSLLSCTNTNRDGVPSIQKGVLISFRGRLHTDDYAGYHNLPYEITVVGCGVHARRKFDKVVNSLPTGKSKSSSATQGLAYYNKLFELEEVLSCLSLEERYVQRLEQAKPVLDALLV